MPNKNIFNNMDKKLKFLKSLTYIKDQVKPTN